EADAESRRVQAGRDRDVVDRRRADRGEPSRGIPGRAPQEEELAVRDGSPALGRRPPVAQEDVEPGEDGRREQVLAPPSRLLAPRERERVEPAVRRRAERALEQLGRGADVGVRRQDPGRVEPPPAPVESVELAPPPGREGADLEDLDPRLGAEVFPGKRQRPVGRAVVEDAEPGPGGLRQESLYARDDVALLVPHWNEDGRGGTRPPRRREGRSGVPPLVDRDREREAQGGERRGGPEERGHALRDGGRRALADPRSAVSVSSGSEPGLESGD